MLIRATFVCLLGLGVGVAPCLAQDDPPQRGLQLDDPLLPLDAKQARTEAEEDQLHAAALFAAARMLEQKGEPAAALRRYQRAARYDANAGPILREIIPLAFSQGRAPEAVRYALIAVEQDPTDPALMRRLAAYLTEQGEYRRAIGLYELLAKEIGKADNTSDAVLIQMELGRLYFLLDEQKKAAQAFTKVEAALDNPALFGLDAELRKTLRGEGDLTFLLFAESYLAAERLDAAEAAYRKADKAKPNPGLLAYNLARVEALRGKSAAALDKLREYFNANSDSEGGGPYELFARLLGDLNQSDTLIPQLEALHTADPDNESLSFFLAQQYLDQDELDKAQPLLEKLRGDEDDKPAVDVIEALIELQIERGEAAPLLAALSDAAGRANTLEPFEDVLAPLEQDGPLVDQLIELARQHREGDAKPPVGEALAIAQLALRVERFDVAQEFFEHALADQPNRQAALLLTWGLELFLADQYQAASDVFQRGVDEKALPEDNPGFYFYLAGALEMAGQTDAALEAARTAAKRQPDSAEFAGRVAWIQYHAKRYEDAQASYLDLLKDFDDEHETDGVRDALREARLVLSNIAVEQDDYKAAEEWLEQVLDEFPEDIGAKNDLGYLWADQNKHLERALRMIETAVAAEPDNLAYLDSLGWVLYRLGRNDEAVAALEKATAAEDPDGVILDHLGDAYQQQGKPAQARAAWNRALRAYEKSSAADKAQQVRAKLKDDKPPDAE